jgi:hypothetical protein
MRETSSGRDKPKLVAAHYFSLHASTFATYLKIKKPEYFAIKAVRRSQTEERRL